MGQVGIDRWKVPIAVDSLGVGAVISVTNKRGIGGGGELKNAIKGKKEKEGPQNGPLRDTRCNRCQGGGSPMDGDKLLSP